MPPLTREQYREDYLRSDHWQATRKDALARAGHRCQVCNAAKRLDVHHRTYERLGAENAMDLTVLCRPCHDLYHTRSAPPEPTPDPIADGPSKRKSKTRTKPKAKRRKVQKPKAPKAPKDGLRKTNDQLHAIQRSNKLKQQLAREGRVSVLLRADLSDRHRQ